MLLQREAMAAANEYVQFDRDPGLMQGLPERHIAFRWYAGIVIGDEDEGGGVFFGTRSSVPDAL